jgi:hypothetical protein
MKSSCQHNEDNMGQRECSQRYRQRQQERGHQQVRLFVPRHAVGKMRELAEGLRLGEAWPEADRRAEIIGRVALASAMGDPNPSAMKWLRSQLRTARLCADEQKAVADLLEAQP